METTARINSPFPAANATPVEGTVHDAATDAHATVDKVAGAVDEAVRNAKPGIDRVAQAAHQAIDKAADAVAPTAEWLDEQGKNLKVTQQKLIDDTSQFVSENPLKVVAIALAAGFLIGRFVR